MISKQARGCAGAAAKAWYSEHIAFIARGIAGFSFSYAVTFSFIWSVCGKGFGHSKRGPPPTSS